MVALGDSITFGYNLGNNKAPSTKAFPYLLGKALHLGTVDDLGVPGATSSDLLKALSTAPYQQALKQAKVVTLDIGSNDLLHAAAPLINAAAIGQPVTVTSQDQLNLQDALYQLKLNLPAIIAAIRQQTNAQIVLYNLYDPIPAALTTLHTISEQTISQANAIIASTAAQTHCLTANAYSAINPYPSTLLLPFPDIHPSVLGQEEFALLAEQALGVPEELSVPSDERAILVNGNLVNEVPAFVKDNTTYMPIWYVMQTLKALGIPSQWNGDTWSIAIPSGQSVNLTSIHLGSGRTQIRLNGTTVGTAPSIAANDPSTGRLTTYVPIYSAMQALLRAGIQYHWDGTSWNMTIASSFASNAK